MTLMDMLFYLSLLIIFSGLVCLYLILSGRMDKWANAQWERAEALRWEKAKERGDRRELWRLAMKETRR